MIKKLVLAFILCVICWPVFAATPVYYSCSPRGTTDDLKVACNISISGGAGVATFSVAQTGNIGVGLHVISAGIDGFISVMTNSTTATIVTALGAAHGNVASEALTSIKHEYASLNAAEAGFTDASHTNNVDLTAADIQANIVCYFDDDNDTVESAATTINFGTTDATRYLAIYTPQGGTESINDQRHDGKITANKYRITTSNADVITNQELFTRIIGLQLTIDSATTGGTRRIINSAAAAGAGATISHNVGRFTNSNSNGARIGFGTGGDVTNNSYLVNNIVFDALNQAFEGAGGDDSNFMYSNTAVDCGIGFKTAASDTTIKNNVAFGCTDAYQGTWQAGGTNNAYDEGADPGSNGIDISADAGTDLFLDYNNDDFHGKDTSSSLYHAGADLDADADFAVTDDIDGDSRHATTPSVGADEFENAPAAVTFIPSVRWVQ